MLIWARHYTVRTDYVTRAIRHACQGLTFWAALAHRTRLKFWMLVVNKLLNVALYSHDEGSDTTKNPVRDSKSHQIQDRILDSNSRFQIPSKIPDSRYLFTAYFAASWKKLNIHVANTAEVFLIPSHRMFALCYVNTVAISHIKEFCVGRSK